MALVLVVDDDEEYSRFMERLLKHLGFKSYATALGAHALLYTKEFRPDLIVLDFCLPGGLSAEKTLRILKTQVATKSIPVIVISGERRTAEDENFALRAGADLFFSKGEIAGTIKDGSFKRHLCALILENQQTPPTAQRAIADEARPLSPGRVLIVDDEPEMVRLLTFLLDRQGYTVLTAHTALDGLAKARQGRPDLLILDMTLPDMSGLDVYSQLKGDPGTREIPIMVLTGQSASEAAAQAVRRGADHFMTKPIGRPEQFLDMVAALLQRKPDKSASPQVLRVGDALIVDEAARAVIVGARTITGMPETLFRLAQEFARNPGRTLDRDHLVRRVWKGKSVRHRVVDQYVRRLRDRFGDPARHWLVTMPGQGYRLIPGARSGGESSENC